MTTKDGYVSILIGLTKMHDLQNKLHFCQVSSFSKGFKEYEN